MAQQRASKTSRLYASLLAVAGLLHSAVPAANELLGVHRAWTAQTYGEGESRVCMMWSQPEKAEGDYTRRGEIYAFVTHRPGEQERDEVRFEAGYPFAPGSGVEVRIGERGFTLRTDGSTAWPADDAAEKAMIAAMRGGREMVVKGTSTRGTDTVDTYSLHGFTAAHKAIDRACK